MKKVSHPVPFSQFLAAVAACVAFALNSAVAGDLHWTGTSDGKTADAANWSEGTAPQAGDSLHFDTKVERPVTVLSQANGDSTAQFGSILGDLAYPYFKFAVCLYDSQNGTSGVATQVGDFAGFPGVVVVDRSSYPLTVSPSGTEATIDRLSAQYGGCVAVDAGKTLTVTNLYFGANLTKQGSGTLRLVKANGNTDSITVDAGTLELAGDGDAGAIVGDPYVHVDASQADAFVTESENGTNFVTRWNDVRGTTGYPCFTTTAAYPERPFLRAAGDAYRYPYAVVDFGCQALNSTTGDVARLGQPATLALSPVSSKIREAFAVVCDTESQRLKYNDERDGMEAFIFGNGGFGFHRYGDGKLFANSGQAGVRTADIRLNDSGVWYNSVMQGSALQVLSVGTSADVPVEYLARDRGRIRIGGLRYGEILLYTNTLTSAERTRVNHHLMRKWGCNDFSADLNVVRLGADAALSVPEGHTGGVHAVVTSGKTLVKKGAGTLALETAYSADDGTVPAIRVEAGIVRFKALETPAAPTFAADPFFRFDADDEATLAKDADGNVTEWHDATPGSARLAVSSGATKPTYVKDQANGRPTVDFGEFYGSGDGAYLTIMCKPGEPARHNWFREAFMVYRLNKSDTTVSPFIIGGSSFNGFH